MRKTKWLAAFVCAAMVLTGCDKGKHKKEAYDHWNHTRAAVQYGLASERYKLGNMDDARVAIDQALKLDPTNANCHVLSARIHAERNQLDLADKELTLARTLDPKNGEADYLAGVIYQRWQKPNLALQHYTSATEKAPNELSYLMARAETLVHLKRLDEAVALIEGKLTLFEYSGPLRDALGGMYLQQNKIPLAIDTLHQATVLSPDDTTIREHYARALFRGAKHRECAEQADSLLKTKDHAERADLYMLKGECLIQMGQYRDARAALETSLAKNPSSATALLLLAKVSMKLNDLDRADLSVRKAIALAPEDSQAHLAQAFVRIKQRRWEEAMTFASKSHELDANDPTALCLMGFVCEQTNQRDQALLYYGQALQIKPNNPLAAKLMSKAK